MTKGHWSLDTLVSGVLLLLVQHSAAHHPGPHWVPLPALLLSVTVPPGPDGLCCCVPISELIQKASFLPVILRLSFEPPVSLMIVALKPTSNINKDD